tara:strand:- start:179 stop:292 length:114 start_codon:yes stop_codon:yes gene_type:complete
MYFWGVEKLKMRNENRNTKRKLKENGIENLIPNIAWN